MPVVRPEAHRDRAAWIARLEHDLCHGSRLALGFQGVSVMFLGRNPELIVESVVPDYLHVFPIRDDTVLNGIVSNLLMKFGWNTVMMLLSRSSWAPAVNFSTVS